MTVETQRYTTVLEGEDRLSPVLGRALSNLNKYESGVHRIGRGMGQIAQGAARLATIGLGAAVAGLGYSVKVAADFEAQLNTINTIAQTTPELLGDIGDGIRKLSRETGASLDDLTTAYYDLLSAGVDVKDAQGILDTATRLATGSLGTTSEAVDILTTAINSYNLTAGEAAGLSDEFAKAVEVGKVTLSDIAPVYADVAPLAASMGIETSEIAAAFGQLTSKGTAAGEVATQMRSALKALLDPTAQLSALQDELGVNFAKIAEEQGLQVALQQMYDAVGGNTEQFNQLFGRIEGFNFALQVTGPNAASFAEVLDEVTHSAGTLDDQVSARRQGLAYNLGILKANLRDIGITIGTAVLPELTPLLAEFADFLTLHADDVTAFAHDLAAGFHDLVSEIKSTDWQPFLDTFGLMAEIGGKVVDIFRSLPPELQAIAITGLAINKLSGGLLGAGAVGVTRGVIDIIFQRGSSPANPLFVQGTGLGGPGGVAGGTAAGGAAGLVRNIAAIGIFTAVATTIGQIIADNITRPMNPTQFDYNAAAGASGNFTTQAAAERFAQSLATQLDIPLEDVKSGIVDAVNNRGLTFDQAVEQLKITQTTTAEQIAGAVRHHGQERSREARANEGTSARIREGVGRLSDVQRSGIAEGRAWEAQRRMLAGQHLAQLAAQNVKLQQIAAKKSTFHIYTTVNVSAANAAANVNTYAKIREG